MPVVSYTFGLFGFDKRSLLFNVHTITSFKSTILPGSDTLPVVHSVLYYSRQGVSVVRGALPHKVVQRLTRVCRTLWRGGSTHWEMVTVETNTTNRHRRPLTLSMQRYAFFSHLSLENSAPS